MLNFKYKFRCLATLFVFIVLSSCATQPRLSIKSPQKEISYSLYAQNKLQKNGVLPFEDDLSALYSNSQIIEIELSGEGLQTKRLIMPKARFIQEVAIDVSLDKSTNDPVGEGQLRDLMNSKNLDELVKEVISFQSLVSNRRLDEANVVAKRLSTQYPRTSVFYDLLGNISYLQGNLSSALSFYKKAEELNPGNQERDQIISTIQGAIR